MIGENVVAMDWVAKSKRVVGSSASMIFGNKGIARDFHRE